MNFLVDAQLPRRLARELHELGHDAVHTLDLPRQNATKDSEINALAGSEGRILVTKDSDFRDSHLRLGLPRRLLQVTTGNIKNADLLALIRSHLPEIEDAFGGSDYVELGPEALILHRRHSQ